MADGLGLKDAVRERMVKFGCQVAGSRATHSCEPRQVRKEATVAGSCVCSGLPGAWLFHCRLTSAECRLNALERSHSTSSCDTTCRSEEHTSELQSHSFISYA